ncbi:hypothetical protein FA15DRAFT_664987 [Coprinopsis marcescibilis]|uniref:Transmembrane protein n=1 Tax=Coprinopsis marcescibilis TaxID=230819 RepID=A0A5C3LJT9_COPMA|nr:hypothetical protein FA15DRAFT_664987 [Coprinopsis marcescibilis]
MEATIRRSLGRILTIAALLVLGLVSFLAVSHNAAHSPSARLHRRELMYPRQEPTPSSSSRTLSGSPSESAFSSTESVSSTSIFEDESSTISSTPSSVVSSVFSQPSPTLSESSILPDPVTTLSSEPPSSSSSAPSSSIATSSLVSSDAISSFSPRPTRARGTRPLGPETTLFVEDDVFFESTVIETETAAGGPEETGTPVGAVSANGFWENKAAVAATFVMVALISLGLTALFVINCLNRRTRARQQRLHQEIFSEKYTGGGNISPSGSRRSRRDVVYDDSTFQGAVVTSSYPFAGAGSAVSSSQQVGRVPSPKKSVKRTSDPTPQPPSTSHSHTSQQTAYWTPNESQQSFSTAQNHGVAPQRTQYTLPSQLQAQAAQPTAAQLPDGANGYAVNANDYYSANYYAAGMYTNAPAANYAAANVVASYPPSSYNPPAPQVAPTTQRGSYPYSIDSFYGGNNGGA